MFKPPEVENARKTTCLIFILMYKKIHQHYQDMRDQRIIRIVIIKAQQAANTRRLSPFSSQNFQLNPLRTVPLSSVVFLDSFFLGGVFFC